MAYDLSVPSSGAKGIYFRDYRGISDVKLFNDVNSMPWDQIYAAPNIDEKLFFFNQLVSSLFQSNVQLSKLCVKSSSCPWYNDYIDNAIEQREKAYQTWNSTRSEQSNKIYKMLRNRDQLVRNAKYRYCITRLDTKLTQISIIFSHR